MKLTYETKRGQLVVS